jgi:hypothetical protein
MVSEKGMVVAGISGVAAYALGLALSDDVADEAAIAEFVTLVDSDPRPLREARQLLPTTSADDHTRAQADGLLTRAIERVEHRGHG